MVLVAIGRGNIACIMGKKPWATDGEPWKGSALQVSAGCTAEQQENKNVRTCIKESIVSTHPSRDTKETSVLILHHWPLAGTMVAQYYW